MKKKVLATIVAVMFAFSAMAQETPPIPSAPMPPSIQVIHNPANLLQLLEGLEAAAPEETFPIVQGADTPPTILFENQDIDSDSTTKFHKTLDKLAESKPKVIRVIISSGGGELDAGLEMAKLIERFPAKVVCIVDGTVASEALAVFQSCDVRQMTQRSVLMGHRVAAVLRGHMTEDQLRNAANDLHAASLAMALATCAKSKMTAAQFMEKTEGGKEIHLDSFGALKEGFVDSIISKVKW